MAADCGAIVSAAMFVCMPAMHAAHIGALV
jgi:hypothetical protein